MEYLDKIVFLNKNMNEKTVKVRNLTKYFDGFLAVDNISFEIEKGEIVGLLGPNGAGKTTTIMMLLGITKPTEGQIKIFGLDLKQNREEILKKCNFSSPEVSFLGRLTVFETLNVFASLYEIKNSRQKITELLKELEIFDLKDNLTTNLSFGERTRLSLCKAFLNDPELLFLDEPTASLDPEIAAKVRGLLSKVRREKDVSILYTSHNMEEVTQMCDRIIFLNRGKIVAYDTPLNLTKMIEDCFLTLTFDACLEKVKKFGKEKNLDFQIPQPNTLEINLKEKEIGEVLTQLAQSGVAITDVMIKRPGLEDVFLKIAKEKNEFSKN